jgi:hypothetical protein
LCGGLWAGMSRKPIPTERRRLRQIAEEILEGYPTLDRERIAMAPLCAQVFPVRKSANRTPWTGEKPEAERSFRLSDLLRNER